MLEKEGLPVSIPMTVFALMFVGLLVLNLYQFLVQRAALRIAEILFIMSRNVRERIADVRHNQKDVEIVEAHLVDIAASSRSLLQALGCDEKLLGPDPTSELSRPADTKSLLRLADNILYTVSENTPEAGWDGVVDRAVDRFLEKVPALDRKGAGRIVAAVARHYREEGFRSLTPFPQGHPVRQPV